MTFEDVALELKNLKCEEKRAHLENYVEIVVAKADIAAVLGVFESFFGAPVKPEGQPVSKEAEAFAKPYGGIQSRQTLYYRKTDTGAELAMLWPWGSGTPITVKFIREKKA